MNPPHLLKHLMHFESSKFLMHFFEKFNLLLIKKWYKKEYNIPQKTSKSIIKLFNRAKIMNTIIG